MPGTSRSTSSSTRRSVCPAGSGSSTVLGPGCPRSDAGMRTRTLRRPEPVDERVVVDEDAGLGHQAAGLVDAERLHARHLQYQSFALAAVRGDGRGPGPVGDDAVDVHPERAIGHLGAAVYPVLHLIDADPLARERMIPRRVPFDLRRQAFLDDVHILPGETRVTGPEEIYKVRLEHRCLPSRYVAA